MQDNKAVLTDENGRYKLTALPPGSYVVVFYYADVVPERANAVVKAGKTAQLSPLIDTSRRNEVIQVRGRPGIVDPTPASGIHRKSRIRQRPGP